MSTTIYDEYVPFYDTKELIARQKNGVLRNTPLKPISQKKCPQSVKPSRYYHNLVEFGTKHLK